MKMQSQVYSTRHYLWFGVIGLLLSGVYNSIQMSSDPFQSQSLNIKFVKRLDEIQGKITVGRMAASATPWVSLGAGQKKDKVKAPVKRYAAPVAKTVAQTKSGPVIDQELAEPAIQEDLKLKLDQVFFKKPLEKGSFSGQATTVDGFIEDITVNLPDGKTLYINTRDRMVGNVFQFEDTQTGELRSGMFYEIKKGKEYMITLTNDSEYAGLRLGFKTADYAELRYDDNYGEENIQWGIENQASNQEKPQQVQATQTEEGGYAFRF